MEIEPVKTLEMEKIELNISTKGVYTWSIKILGTDVNRLEILNEQMLKRFAVKNEVNTIDI